MTVGACLIQQAGPALEARETLVLRLFPSLRYEFAQIATALSVNAAATTRWLAAGQNGLEEARASEGKTRLLIRRADSLMRAVTSLSAADTSGNSVVDLGELATTGIAITRHAVYQAGSVVSAPISSNLLRAQADPAATLHLLLVLLLLLADAGAGVIEIGGRRDNDTVVLTIKAGSAAFDQSLAERLSTFGHAKEACGLFVSHAVAQGVELTFSAAPPSEEGTSGYSTAACDPAAIKDWPMVAQQSR